MAVNHAVRAAIVDIRQDALKKEDTFLFDTNVWYWLAYGAASITPSAGNKVKDYPAFIKKAISAKSQLRCCGLSLSELAHLIEGNERAIYNSQFNANLSPKEFRHNFPSERSNVVAEIQAAWGQVTAMSKMLDVTVNADATDRALQRMAAEPLDGYDLFFLEAMSKAGIASIITDDGDYAVCRCSQNSGFHRQSQRDSGGEKTGQAACEVSCPAWQENSSTFYNCNNALIDIFSCNCLCNSCVIVPKKRGKSAEEKGRAGTKGTF